MLHFTPLVFREKEEMESKAIWLIAFGDPALGQVPTDVANVRNFRVSANAVTLIAIYVSYINTF